MLAVVLCLPVVSRSLGTPVGAFSMFERLERYRLTLHVRTAAGERQVALKRLIPHLSQAAQRIIMPAESNALGADQVPLLAGGLPDLAVLVCRLHPGATSARVQLTRSPLRSNPWTQAVEHSCKSQR